MEIAILTFVRYFQLTGNSHFNVFSLFPVTGNSHSVCFTYETGFILVCDIMS